MIWTPILFNTYTIGDSGILSSLIGLICNWLTFPLKVLIFGFPLICIVNIIADVTFTIFFEAKRYAILL